MKTSTAWACYLLIAACPPVLMSAQITNESFGSGANGWIDSTTFGTGNWSFTGGVARVNFINTGIAFPDGAKLSGTASASSGAFTGNYDQAGINLVGFSFLAPQIVPPTNTFVVLEWGGSTSIFQKGFSVTATGVWHHFSVSLSDEAKGQWTTIQGSKDNFVAARQSVSFILISVSRNGILEHEYVIDNIFLAGQPSFGALAWSTGSTFHARADDLLSNRTYDVESAPEVTGTWTMSQSFISTNTMQWINITNIQPQQLFWRMVIP